MSASLFVDELEAVRGAEVLRAAGHPLRLQILAVLCEEPRCVGTLVTMLASTQSAVSQQLRILRMSGLVIARRSRGRCHYELQGNLTRDLVRCVSAWASDAAQQGAGRAARDVAGEDEEP